MGQYVCYLGSELLGSGHAVFLSTFEKPLDAKRRIVVPAEFRDAAKQDSPHRKAFDGLYCFGLMGPQGEDTCLECGGSVFFDHYQGLIEQKPFGSQDRLALENAIYAGMQTLNFDSGGRITMTDALLARFGFGESVILVGLYDRFQIWRPETYGVHQKAQRLRAQALFHPPESALVLMPKEAL
jgi:MraZ protein